MSDSTLYKGRIGRLIFARNIALLGMAICTVIVAVQYLQSVESDLAGVATILLIAVTVFWGAVYSLHNVIRRLHDLNRSGWYAAVFYIPPIFVLLLIALLLVPGSPGSNRFGEPSAA